MKIHLPGNGILAAAVMTIGLISAADAQTATAPDAAALSQSGECSSRPNILLVVWDTVRADYMGLYGYGRPTTPFLDEWSRGARVYEDCISVGSTTVPTHVSMFTGLLPLEHGVTNATPTVGDDFQLLAESLKDAGYDTYMFSENPKIAERNKITQGFDAVEHPWSPAYRERSLQFMLERVPPDDRSTNLTSLLRQPRQKNHSLKTAGPCLAEAVLGRLAARPAGKPFFVFLNCMTAHYPLVPGRAHRAAVMTPEQVERSYQVDRTAWQLWSYVFRRHEYSDEEIELTRLTYAAAVRELDASFRDLLTRMEKDGYLENTAVILTSDHGEHLGEHHLLDHQYSVYEPLLRVPLILRYPPAVAAGRAREPVTNMDIYPTLLELAGLPAPEGTKAISLLHAPASRARLGTYTGVERKRFASMRRAYPDLDPAAWDRTLHAFYTGPYKLIRGSDGRNELYQIANDPGENADRYDAAAAASVAASREYSQYLSTLQKPRAAPRAASAPASAEEIQRLRALGYMEEDTENTDDSAPATAPASAPAAAP
jgi:arylsulfatase A-like enzyme